MYSIDESIEIAASLATLRAAVSTPDGFRAWLAADTRVDAAGRFTFSFAPREVTFRLDRADAAGVAMTCEAELDNPDWLGTRLLIRLTPLGDDETRVELRHEGYRTKNECYAQCIAGWQHFLSSLARYATTGKGAPFDSKLDGPAPARPSAEVAS
jgi:uncharacterized protein YndB with AHSA1/START domain